MGADMAHSMRSADSARHRLLSETPAPSMAKMDLRKAETRDFRLAVGQAIQRAQLSLGWSLKEFAARLGKDERQVARWEAGTERAQFDALFALDDFRWPLIQRLAQLDDHVELVTQIRRPA